MIIKKIKQNKTGFTQHHLFTKSGAGFTLVEVLVAVSIFALLAILLSVIYVSFTKMQTRTQISQQVLNDSQFTLETMAREIRNNEIYEYDPYGDDSAACKSVLGDDYENCLLLLREDGQMIAFTTTIDNALLYVLPDCNNDYSICSWALDDYESYTELLSLTINNIKVEDLYFNITPQAGDPFSSASINEHPVVTIRLKTAYNATRSNEAVSHLLQTTIASRIYKR